MGAPELKVQSDIPQSIDLFQEIRRKINHVRKRSKCLSLYSAFFSWLSLIVGVAYLFILGESYFWLSSQIRMAGAILYFFMILILGIKWEGLPLFSLLFQHNKPNDDSIAINIGQKFPSIRDKLVDALQVYRVRQQVKERTSSELAEEALAYIYKTVKGIDFNSTISFTRLRILLIRFVFILSICSLLTLLMPNAIRQSIHRLSHPDQHFQRPSLFQLKIDPGDVHIVEGESLLIKISATGKVPQMVFLVLQENGEKPFEISLQAPFMYKLETIRKKIKYFARSGRVHTESYLIQVLERPSVRILQVVLNPPRYSGIREQQLEPNIGDIEVLAGTVAKLYVKTNKPVIRASILFEKKVKIDLEMQGTSANGSFVAFQNDQYWIDLEDDEGMKNNDPIRYTIRIKQDDFPSARIVSPEENVDLDESMIVPLVLEANDDFGIQKSQLGFFKSNRGQNNLETIDTLYAPVPFNGKEPLHLFINWNWKLGSIGLLPEDVLSYFFSVEDNDRISGPKLGRSLIHTIRFPSIEEIYQEVEKNQSDQIQLLTEIYEESKSLLNEIEQIRDQQKIGKDIGWEEKKDLEDKINQQSIAAKQFDSLQADLDDLVRRMEKNDLLGIQTIEKYLELQKLYEEMASPEFLEVMNQFQEALKKLSEEDLKKAMERFQFSQEDFLRSIERTLSLLKRIRIEQKTDELIKRIQNLANRQKEVNNQLDKRKENNSTDLFPQEEGIQKDADAFQEETKKLQLSMRELDRMPTRKMDSLMTDLISAHLVDMIENMKQSMISGNKSDALSRGSHIVQKMQTVEQSLIKMKRDIQSKENERLVNAMRRASLGLLRLSQEQEKLMQSLKNGEITGTQAEEKQITLSKNVDHRADSLYQLSQETFFITPDIGKSLGEAKSAMQQALENLNGADYGKAQNFQGKAMGSLNQALISMLRDMDNFSQNSGSGMEQFFLQLQKMGEEQAAINRKMMDMLGKGILSLEDQAGMARLVAEQESLKQRLQELVKEYGNRSNIAGNLNNLVKEMEELVQEMKNQNADRRTIQTQERILSRLLEAQHSLYLQDFSQKRQAKVGKDKILQSPPLGGFGMSQTLERFRKDLLRAEKEGYTKDYLELILRYFKALSNSDSNY